mgnify:CR=1 FL=1
MRSKDLTKNQIQFILDNRLLIPVSEMALINSCSKITVRKHYNKRQLSYLNDKGKIRHFKTKGKINSDNLVYKGYKPKNMTKGEKKHINQQIKPPERFF